MGMRKEEKWRCQNPFCSREILVMSSSEVEGGTNARCSCGSWMKKPYVPPVLRSLPATEKEGLLFDLPKSQHGGPPLTGPQHAERRLSALIAKGYLRNEILQRIRDSPGRHFHFHRDFHVV